MLRFNDIADRMLDGPVSLDLAAARDGPGDRMKLLDHGSRERGGMVPGAPPQVREVPVAREAVRPKSSSFDNRAGFRAGVPSSIS